ncbi:hypothetical protein [Mycobacterium sp. 852002-51613_SCH5001154]|uniref:hypothetical protein n=1 Tax=Mycobacterium sp. 852002-51613_SCH5001154 TaxID=1834104 RepID=UPI0009EE7BE6|nr:hypothetical protein [Mycobacterium sp. 852002-51613_SCH5001154]
MAPLNEPRQVACGLVSPSPIMKAVSAQRLSEKGFRVGVLERGRRYEPADLPASAWQTHNFAQVS